MRIRTSPRPSVLPALVAVAAVAGCGGGNQPALRRADVAPLITLADRIPGEAACAQARDIRALRARTTALVNAGRIDPRFAENLSSGVNALVLQTPACVPKVAATPTPAVVPARPQKHDKQKGHGKDGHEEND